MNLNHLENTISSSMTDTKIRRNQKVIKDANNKLIVESYPKKQKEVGNTNIQKKTQCPSCSGNALWLNMLDEYYQCEVCDVVINKTKNMKQVKRSTQTKIKNFSTRLPYGGEQLNEIYQ